MWFLSPLFIEGLLQKALQLIRPADWSTAVTSHAAVNIDARSIQISSQNI